MRVDWTLSVMVEMSGDFRSEVDGWDLDETAAPSEKAPGKRRKLSLSLNREARSAPSTNSLFVFLPRIGRGG